MQYQVTSTHSQYTPELQQALARYDAIKNPFAGSEADFSDVLEPGELAEFQVARAINITVDVLKKSPEPDFQKPLRLINEKLGKTGDNKLFVGLPHVGVVGDLRIHNYDGLPAVELITNVTTPFCPFKNEIKDDLERDFKKYIGNELSGVWIYDQYEDFIRRYFEDDKIEDHLKTYASISGEELGDFLDNLARLAIENHPDYKNDIIGEKLKRWSVANGIVPAIVPPQLLKDLQLVHEEKDRAEAMGLNWQDLKSMTSRTGPIVKHLPGYLDRLNKGGFSHPIGTGAHAQEALAYFDEIKAIRFVVEGEEIKEGLRAY